MKGPELASRLVEAQEADRVLVMSAHLFLSVPFPSSPPRALGLWFGLLLSCTQVILLRTRTKRKGAGGVCDSTVQRDRKVVEEPHLRVGVTPGADRLGEGGSVCVCVCARV